MKFSVLIPCYNEKEYILKVLKKVNEQKKNYDLEIIVSDDYSNDGTLEILKRDKQLYDKLVECNINLGKGSAIKNALQYITGDVVIIQDADLEYDPNDFKILFEPFLKNNADVVYGSRFQGSSIKRVLYFRNRMANGVITFLSNLLTNLNFTDVETGYKVFKAQVLKGLNLQENSFAFEIESTMKIAKKKLVIFEVGISYKGRTIDEGKKIKFIDGIKAVISIFKYKFFS